MDYKKLNTIVGWMVFLFATTVYVMTLEPTTSLWDCGEYITTAYKLEVGHPPGAPLFNMVGRIFTVFSSQENAAFMVNLSSGLSSSFTILFLFWTITMIAKKTLLSPTLNIFGGQVNESSNDNKSKRDLSQGQMWAIIGSGLIGALAYTFTDSFWFSAVEGEVYAMSSFFTAAVVWAIFKWDSEMADVEYEKEENGNYVPAKNPDRWLVFIFFMIGLSIGVHLLNLLSIPVLAYVIYFRKYKETTLLGFLITGILGIVVLGFIQAVLIPMTVQIASGFERVFVNSFGMPFSTGTVVFFLILISLLAFGLIFTKQTGKTIANTVLWSTTMIFIGYSCFAMIVIRSNENPPLDENDPENLVSLQAYLKREQYGDWPILYGQYYNAQVNPQNKWNDRSDVYLRRYVVKNTMGQDAKGFKSLEEAEAYVAEKGGTIEEKYFKTFSGENAKPTFKPEHSTFFPRMYSGNEQRHISGYKSWSGHNDFEIQSTMDEFGNRVDAAKYVKIYDNEGNFVGNVPTFGENLKYFFSYQVDWMYWRYFMWNFSGRQNDEQGHGGPKDGNWISGLNFIDKHHIGDQTKAPAFTTENPSNNKFYMLPLILGIIGFVFMLMKSVKEWWVVLLLFFFTGFAIIIYLNQKPFEPRERDYAYAASFYAFSIWIGMSVLAMYDAFKSWKWKDLAYVVGTFVVLGLIFVIGDKAAGISLFYIAVVIAALLGIMMLLRSAIKSDMQASIIAIILTLPTPIIMGMEGWDDHDRSNRYTARDLAHNYLIGCGAQGIVFTNGDNDTFPLWYLQEVEGVKTDVRVCNLSLLNTDWYTEQMTKKAYESEPLPISFTEEQYRQYGVRDYLYVAGTNELTMGSSEIMPQWKPIMDAKIAANPDLFKAGYKNATNSLYAILAPTKFATDKADLYNAIPSMDSTATYYEFRNLIFNILSKGQEMFGMDMNQLTAVQNIMLQFNDSFDYLPADYAMKFLANDDNIQSRGQGNEFLILPSKGLRVDVNTENALAAGIIDEGDMDRVEDVIYWKIPKRVIYKADLMILDMIAHFDWKRPIYFAASADASTYLGLQKYFYAEGLVYKLVPIVVEQGTNPNSLGEVHKEKMYENLVTNFKYGNMMEEGVLIDYYIRRTMTNNYRVQFSVLADAYGEDYAFNEKKIELLERIQGQAGEPDQVVRTEIGTFTRSEIPTEIAKAKETMEFSKARATEVLDFSLQVMPEENVPLGKVMPQYVSGYFQVGNQEKGKLYAEKMFNIYEEELEYYLDIEPEFSAQMVNDMFDSYRGYFSVFQVTFSLCDDEAFIASLTERFSGMTNRVKMGLNPIRNYSSVSAQRVMGTFDSLFSTYKALFDMMGVQG